MSCMHFACIVICYAHKTHSCAAQIYQNGQRNFKFIREWSVRGVSLDKKQVFTGFASSEGACSASSSQCCGSLGAPWVK